MHPLLQPHILLRAYASGLFPMAEADGQIYWFSPDPRAVIFPARSAVPRSARSLARSSPFEIRLDTAFERVIEACSTRPEGSWINTDIMEAYCQLRDLGFAHSVEAWQGDELVGGLYGVSLGSVFFGESMFHTATGASKHALMWLIERCRQAGYAMLDVQWLTPHLELYGSAEVARERYLRTLAAGLRQPSCFLRRQEVPQDWVVWHRQPDEAALERRLLAAGREGTQSYTAAHAVGAPKRPVPRTDR
jgi:leucyl/phenylalanyl-tRNA---protein transferase